MQAEKPVVLVVGGSGGIGSAVLRRLVALGMRCVGTFLKGGARVQALAAACPEIRWISCDLTKEAEVASLVETVTRDYGSLDILINCATAPLKLKPFWQLTSTEAEEDFRLILEGSWRICRQVVPHMKTQKRGTIVHLLSAAMETVPARMSSYLAAKFGVLGMTKSLAVELAPFQVRVLNLSPSFVETDLLGAFPAKLLEIERAKQPGGHFLLPDEIAQAVEKMLQHPETFPSGSLWTIHNAEDLKHPHEA